MTVPVVLAETQTLGINSEGNGLAVVDYTTVLPINKLDRIRESYVQTKIARRISHPGVATITKFKVYDEKYLQQVMDQLTTYFLDKGYQELVYFAPNDTLELMELAGFSKVQDALTQELGATFMYRGL